MGDPAGPITPTSSSSCSSEPVRPGASAPSSLSIKSSVRGLGCCYLCMFVSIRTPGPLCPSIHFLTGREGASSCTLCCSGIIVISSPPKTHCFTCSRASPYISLRSSSNIHDRCFPEPTPQANGITETMF